MIDTGFFPDHQDLVPTRSDREIELHGMIPTDTGHGTEVGGIIAAAHNTGYGRAGVCPDSRITAVRVDPNKYAEIILNLPVIGGHLGNYAVLGEAVRIINDLAQQAQSKVLCISKSVTLDKATAEDLARTHLLAPIDDFLGRGGILVVGGANDKNFPVSTCFPAAIRQVSSKSGSILVVGSVDASRVESHWNGELWEMYTGQNDVDLYAPGGDQEVLDYKNLTDYKKNNGNSLAIPHVAGVAALLLQIDPGLTGEQMANIIRKTAELQERENNGEPVRVVNAFAAALKVYNRRSPDAPLAGYRVSMPDEFNEGMLEVNGEPVQVSTAGFAQCFCRFVAPRDREIRARLFRHPDLEPGEKPVCYWEGSFATLLSAAMEGSTESAWSHSEVDELRTVRLQGLALEVWYGGAHPGPVVDASVVLKDRRRKGWWSIKTDSTGRFVVPFGEPGPYTLIVKEAGDAGARFEVDLQLEGNTIYTEYPEKSGKTRIILDEPVPRNRWLNGFAGMVFFDGSAQQNGAALKGARGPLTFRALARSITPEIFLHHCYGSLTSDDLEFEERLAGEDGTASMSVDACVKELSDMMPDLEQPHTRVSSIVHGTLANRHNGMWQHRFDSEQWYEGQEIPPGVVLATGGEECQVTIDIADLSWRLLNAWFRDEVMMQPPWSFKLSFGFFLDHAKAQGTGTRFLQEELTGTVTVADVPCYIDRYLTEDRRKFRVVAGPCENALQFVKHPESPLRFEHDPQPAPAGCISAICIRPGHAADLPVHLLRVVAVGSQGEIGVPS
jgi:hypothetical protein